MTLALGPIFLIDEPAIYQGQIPVRVVAIHSDSGHRLYMCLDKRLVTYLATQGDLTRPPANA